MGRTVDGVATATVISNMISGIVLLLFLRKSKTAAFAIAALVCSTTMSRMVSDERGIIGTMRALGFTDTAIVMKYAIYAGSASVLGGVLGFLGGTKLFPAVIWEVYAMMYGFTTLEFATSVPLFILSLGVALICTVGVSVVTAMSALTGMPAELIRPKAPLPGKKIAKSTPLVYTYTRNIINNIGSII